ncbi:MAG: hypothetical protein AB7T31_03080 [Gemmatimonadales bacterium]
MARSPVRRLVALGSIALLPVSFFAHLQMECIPAPTAATESAGRPVAQQHADHSHHAQHAAVAVGDEDASDSSSDSGTIPHHGQCNLCCPQGATIPTVEPVAVFTLLAVHVAHLDAHAPVLGRAPHLLPFPNPPPVA